MDAPKSFLTLDLGTISVIIGDATIEGQATLQVAVKSGDLIVERVPCRKGPPRLFSDEELLAAARNAESVTEVAKRLRCSPPAVRERARKIDMPLPPYNVRVREETCDELLEALLEEEFRRGVSLPDEHHA